MTVVGREMGCAIQDREAAGLLLSYCAGTLPPEQIPPVERHLEYCGECREWVGAQNVLWQHLECWKAPDVSRDFNRRLYHRIDEEELTRNPLARWVRRFASRWSPFPWRTAMPVGAACAILVAALVIQPSSLLRSQNRDESSAKMERIDAEQVERTLDDLDMLKQLSPRIGETERSHPI
jgi:anti-sigma factor RsiW